MSGLESRTTIHRAGDIWTVVKVDGRAVLKSYKSAAMVVNDDGTIISIGNFDDLSQKHPSAALIDHGSSTLVPGFVDAHLHCPQLDVIGSGGYHLLDWLEQYVFPAEGKFAALDVAVRGAKRLSRELVRHGVTTAAVFSSVHAHAAEALFQNFERTGLRLVTGKTSMDIGAPKNVTESVEADIEAQEKLIATWHGRHDRLFYAITPRFALSCSRPMMKALQELKERHPTCYVQTHISENVHEVKDVLAEWKEFDDYLAVYEEHGLIGNKTLLAHGIYLTDSELARLSRSKTSIVHCPTSNTFLGSGLFNLERSTALGVNVCLASDIGAGTGLSPWQTMLECYKVQALQGHLVTADELLYRGTLAGAEALGLDNRLGSLEVGKQADFVVLHTEHNELLSERLRVAKDPAERLFACVTMGDDRMVHAVYVAGRQISQGQHRH
jgi:guanine deaminase